MKRCYVVAKLNTKTLKVSEVGLYSESAQTLTYIGGGYCYLDVFSTGGVDFEAAIKSAVWMVESDDLFEWARPFVRKDLIHKGMV